jgi:hypothetical protein
MKRLQKLMASKDKQKVPAAMREKYEEITAITDRVCTEHLNEEYAALCRKAAAALSRKRPSPLKSGRAKSWAAGVVYAMAQINFLFDSTQTPHMEASELVKALGVSHSTTSSKAKAVRDALDLFMMDPNYSLPSLLDDNPMVWLLSVNGMIVDVRTAPRKVQEIAFEKGLIPYIPADRIGK